LIKNEPSALVASSNKRIFGFDINARAIATKNFRFNQIHFIEEKNELRCFCPPLNLSPEDVL